MPKKPDSSNQKQGNQNRRCDQPGLQTPGGSSKFRRLWHVLLPLNRAEFLRKRRVPNFIRVKVHDRDGDVVLHLTFAEIMQISLPLAILSKIVGNAFREQNMARIPTVHHPLRHVNSSASDVWSVVYVSDAADRSAVNTHSNAEIGTTFQRFADLQRALDRSVERGREDQRHAVAGRDPREFLRRFGALKYGCAADNLV